MNPQSISRKDFIRNSSILLASSCLLPTESTQASLVEKQPLDAKNLILKNVRLETGFDFNEGEVIHTRTELFTIEVTDGKISKIFPNRPDAAGIDAKGLLMLPPFRDMHIHLDKTYYGLPWQAHLKKNKSVKDMIAFEQQVIPELLKTSTQRTEKLIALLQSLGTNYARSHVNIEPTSKLDSLKHLQLALERKKLGFEAELVAFPQHGIYYTDSAQLMREAAQLDIDFIGGLDPTGIDGGIEKQIDFVVQLALDYHKGIDIHLHEAGESGIQTIEYLIKKVMENPVLKGKTYVSHAFALRYLEKGKTEEIAEQLRAAKIGIASTIPLSGTPMPIPTLYKHGVEVLAGNDCIVDHWSTFGSGSILQKANIAAQLYGYRTEFDLSRILKLATGGMLPLNEKGEQQWPKVGDQASWVLVDASCSAEAVSRVSPIKSLVNKGNVVFS